MRGAGVRIVKVSSWAAIFEVRVRSVNYREWVRPHTNIVDLRCASYPQRADASEAVDRGVILGSGIHPNDHLGRIKRNAESKRTEWFHTAAAGGRPVGARTSQVARRGLD